MFCKLLQAATTELCDWRHFSPTSRDDDCKTVSIPLVLSLKYWAFWNSGSRSESKIRKCWIRNPCPDYKSATLHNTPKDIAYIWVTNKIVKNLIIKKYTRYIVDLRPTNWVENPNGAGSTTLYETKFSPSLIMLQLRQKIVPASWRFFLSSSLMRCSSSPCPVNQNASLSSEDFHPDFTAMAHL